MRVLFATDGSTNSEHAAALLVQLKHAEPLEIDVLSVANLAAAQGPGEFDLGTNFSDAIQKQAESAATKATETFTQAGLVARSSVVEGHPGSTIVDKAKELQSDLVVIGAQGYSLLARLLLGSVSDFVATHAPCSVLVVRDTSFIDDHRPMKACIGYDDSAPSRNAVRELGKSGWVKNSHVDFVTVVAIPVDGFSDIPIQIDPQEVISAHQSLIEKAVEQAKQDLSADLKGHVLRGGNVGLVLADFVEQEKSDLIVVGDTGRGLVARFFLGSVSRSVLRHAPCSVWLVREKTT